jgi:hypothetical protein
VARDRPIGGGGDDAVPEAELEGVHKSGGSELLALARGVVATASMRRKTVGLTARPPYLPDSSKVLVLSFYIHIYIYIRFTSGFDECCRQPFLLWQLTLGFLHRW